MPTPTATWLTTGQAARLCAVKPDTVLKWIKKGRLPALRTAGGHFRVDRRSLAGLMPGARAVPEPEQPAVEGGGQPLRCWEYLSPSGAVREECKQCIVYRARASWCFQLAGMQPEVGHARRFCGGASCQDCVYYRRVKGLSINVLVLSSDRELISGLAGDDDEGITLRFARNVYEASAVISDFRPAFVVVDEELAASQPELVECLACDPRIPGVRIILGVPRGTAAPGGAWEKVRAVTGIIEKPFGRRRIAAVISSFPVESAALANAG